MAAVFNSIGLFFLLLLFSGCSDNAAHRTVQGYVDARYTYLSSTVGGQLQKLLVTRGDQVIVGQLLARLDPEPEQAQLAQATHELENAEQTLQNLVKGERQTVIQEIVAQVSQAEVNLRLAQQNLQRKAQLYRKGTIGKAEYDEAITNADNLKHKVSEAKAKLADAKLGGRENLILAQQATVKALQANVNRLEWFESQKEIYAPSKGQVFDTFYQAGEHVMAGKPIVALLAPTDIYITFFLSEEYLKDLHIGSQIDFICHSCKEYTPATISYISPQTEFTPPIIYNQTVHPKLVYRVEATISEKSTYFFRPGQPVTVRLLNKK